jgi:nicotinamidase-related amidase
MPELRLDPKRTALVLIDLQRGVVSRETAPLSADEVVENAARLAGTLRAAGAPVVLVRVSYATDGSDALHPETDEQAPSSRPPEGWDEIDPRVGPGEGDLVVTKRQWGAFYGTELDLLLRRRGVSHLVLGGIATNFGVESTARDAYERGYHQIFASDAMAALSAEDHDFALRRIFPRMGRIRTTGEIIEGLG